ncbi:MAG: FtsW/RodA/SpoVE family cell cycle protein [Clostridia bacterium]|nr:FtsW/RodA/SpoVE family cell cycle protein [Clostridia bacterium]
MNRLLARIADFIRETDKLLLSLCVFSSLYGCLAVFTSTRYLHTSRPFLVQLISLVLGVTAAVVISVFDFETFLRRWYLFAALGVIPVILTFFFGFAPGGTDDKAWLDFGFTTFQPSELLKICFIVTFSTHLNKVKKEINKPKYLIPLCIHGAFPVLLIHFQGDDGTAVVFLFMFVCMMWAAGVSWKYFVAAFSVLLISSPLIYFFVMNEDQRSRIIHILDIESDIKGATYQQYYGRMALANGGFFGQGLFKGRLTQVGYVPEGQNDFIFVSIGEELGFLGCLAVLILLAAICLRTVRIARICQKDAGKYICIGFFGMIFSQIIINVGMCIAVLPVIGVTLPFFSAGGTSLLCLFLGVGLVLNVDKHRHSRTIYLHD